MKTKIKIDKIKKRDREIERESDRETTHIVNITLQNLLYAFVKFRDRIPLYVYWCDITGML